jgi:hypothetical protein
MAPHNLKREGLDVTESATSTTTWSSPGPPRRQLGTITGEQAALLSELIGSYERCQPSR